LDCPLLKHGLPLLKIGVNNSNIMRIITTTLIFLFQLTTIFGQTTKDDLKISHLVGGFYIFITYNLFNGNRTPANGMYLVTETSVVLFDTPWDTTQFQPLLDSIKIKHNKIVTICIATHSHSDRTGGLEYYKRQGIKTYTTKQTDEISKKRDNKRAEFLIYKDTVFTEGNYSFQTYYPGQGHTTDNIIVWFYKDKIIYGGCLIKSIEAVDLGNVADANVNEWASAIKNIQRKFKRPNFIIPGHQKWTGKESLNHTLKLIKQAEKNYR
jgi:metallo-beta-lactamase class B